MGTFPQIKEHAMKSLPIFRVLGCLTGALVYYLISNFTDFSNRYNLLIFLICSGLGTFCAEKLFKFMTKNNLPDS